LLRCRITDAPFAANAYLWKSIEIEVTPGTSNSKRGTGAPQRRKYGSRKPPMQPSTWSRRSFSSASRPISSIGSTTPCAYETADPTSRIVFGVMAARIAPTSALKVFGSTAESTGFTPR